MSPLEGEDKPLKYPALFRRSEALVLNKVDLLPYVSVKVEEAEQYARRVQPGLRVFRTSCVTGDGIQEWIEWVSERRQFWRRVSLAS